MALGAAAALDGETGRLVQHDHRIVAVQHRVSQHRFVAWRGLSRPLRSRCSHLLQSRNADGLARHHMVTGAGALAVDPDPPGTQQPFEAPMAECGIVALEPAIETNRPVLAGDRHGVGGVRRHRGSLTRGCIAAVRASTRAPWPLLSMRWVLMALKNVLILRRPPS